MSILPSKSSRTRLLPAKAWGGLLDTRARHSSIYLCGACNRWAAFGQRARCSSSIHWQASASQESGRACAGDKIWRGVDFSTGDAVGLRAVGRRGVACWNSPSAAAAGPRASAPGGAEARGRAGVGGSRLRGDRSASARCDDFRRRLSSGPLPLRCVASVHARFVPFCSTDFLRCGGVGSLSETLFVPHYVLLRGPRCLSRFVCVLL